MDEKKFYNIRDIFEKLDSHSYKSVANYSIRPGHKYRNCSAYILNPMSGAISTSLTSNIFNDATRLFNNLCNTLSDWNLAIFSTHASVLFDEVKEDYQSILNLLNTYSIKAIKYTKLFTQNYGAYSTSALIISTTDLPKLVFFPLESNLKSKQIPDLDSCKLCTGDITLDETFNKQVKSFIDGGAVNVELSDVINLDKNTKTDLKRIQSIVDCRVSELTQITNIKSRDMIISYVVDLTPVRVLFLSKFIDQAEPTVLNLCRGEEFINRKEFLNNEQNLIAYLSQYF